MAQMEAKTCESALNSIMRQIQENLPEGYVTTNKKPIRKKIRSISSSYYETYWTSWCKDASGATYLALLKVDDEVKLIPADCIKAEYECSNAKIA